jgi:hypothetical protein
MEPEVLKIISELSVTQTVLIIFFTLCILSDKRRNNVVKAIKIIIQVLPISKIIEAYIKLKFGNTKTEKLEDVP